MDTFVKSESRDDAEFVHILNSLICNLVRTSKPDHVFVVEIDNWFDHKWLGFSGIGQVDFQFPEFMKRDDGALEPQWKDKTTLPPFAPNRVTGQRHFQMAKSEYVESELEQPLHSGQRMSSDKNLQKRIEDRFDSAVFVWYSSNTRTNGRGSVMVYSVFGKNVSSWFAAFVRTTQWSVGSTKGVKKDEILKLIA